LFYLVQFNITNTLQESVLEGVSVLMTATEEGLTEDFIIPADAITADAPGVVYVSFTRTAPQEFALSSFECTLKFVSKEVDPATGTPEEEGYDDEYQVEQLDLGAGDVGHCCSFGPSARLMTLCGNSIFPLLTRRSVPSGSDSKEVPPLPRPLRCLLLRA
jgi:hypothetical protein